jgi:hypothetical protein
MSARAAKRDLGFVPLRGFLINWIPACAGMTTRNYFVNIDVSDLSTLFMI